MTTPFKALSPFSPRYIEINYRAPDGGCCSLSSSSGSQQSFPDDPIPTPDNFQYFFQPPFGGYTWLMWVQDPIDPSQRILIEEFFIDGTDPVDITDFFRNIENEQIPGVQRKVFFTQLNSTTSATTEFAFYTSFSAESGTTFGLEVWNNVPEYEALDGWVNDPNVQIVVIENYRQGHATFTVGDPPIVIGPGSLFKEASGSTHASFPAIPSYVLGDFTIEFWQYIMSSPAPQNFGRLVDNNFSTGFAINWQNGNKLANEGPGIGLTSFNDAIVLDTWQHYAIRRTGTTLDLIVNGVIVRTGTVSATVLNIAGFIYIGGPAETLQSYTSDLRLWGVSRSDAEILANYQLRLTGAESGLLAYYPIYETDSVFVDFTGNNDVLFLKTNTTDGVPAPGRLCYDPLTPPCFP